PQHRLLDLALLQETFRRLLKPGPHSFRGGVAVGGWDPRGPQMALDPPGARRLLPFRGLALTPGSTRASGFTWERPPPAGKGFRRRGRPGDQSVPSRTKRVRPGSQAGPPSVLEGRLGTGWAAGPPATPGPPVRRHRSPGRYPRTGAVQSTISTCSRGTPKMGPGAVSSTAGSPSRTTAKRSGSR